jgi:hypothetical protein
MENSLNVQIDGENLAKLSPISYPPSINFEHRNEKAENQRQRGDDSAIGGKA